jgi:thioredoxin-related protein
MYVLGAVGTDVNEYTLTTAWDVSTAFYVQNFSVSAQDTVPTGLFFKSDGLKMYILGDAGNDVNEYSLGGFDVSAQDTAPYDIFFKPDGTKMYVLGIVGRDVNEYGLSTAWDVSTASYQQNFSAAAQEITAYGLSFKHDGTKMYVVGAEGDDVNEYDLSTAWDVSTATYNQNFSVAAQDTSPRAIFFKPDGTKFYILGGSGGDVNEYDLSTAWDVSTSSYVQNFSINAQEIFPYGLSFKPDGLKMYVIGTNGDDVNEYDLSTAWDISTASYLQNFSVSGQDGIPHTVFFKGDGTKMYVLGDSSDKIYTYTLGVQE